MTLGRRWRGALALGLIHADMFDADNPIARTSTQQIPQMLESELDPAVRAAERAAARRIAAPEKARRERPAREDLQAQ